MFTLIRMPPLVSQIWSDTRRPQVRAKALQNYVAELKAGAKDQAADVRSKMISQVTGGSGW